MVQYYKRNEEEEKKYTYPVTGNAPTRPLAGVSTAV
jgi:hypothetical protein